jgi:hydrogenase expression/formation protein HypC
MCFFKDTATTEIYTKEGLRMGKIDFGGISREACLEYVPEAEVGHYAVIHVGFAINLLSEEEAAETLRLISEISEFEEELGPSP